MAEEPRHTDEIASTGARLRQLLPRIVEVWKQRVSVGIPAAAKEQVPILVDHIPSYLEQLAANLAGPSPRETLERDSGQLADQHGRQRAQLPGYVLEHVVTEYQLLRDVLFEELERDEPCGSAARNLLLFAFDLGIRRAAGDFVRSRMVETQRAQQALAEANAGLETRVLERTLELTRSEERFRAMVEGVKDYAIFTLDPRGHITTWNVGAERMKSYSVSEAIGRHFSMLYPEEATRRDEPSIHLKVAETEGRFRGEGLRIRKNRDLFVADVSITPIYEHGVLRGFTKVVQDLTERNLLIQERDLTRTHAEALEIESEYRKRFVATLTHDLRSPLSAARVAAQMIARSPEKQDKVRTWAMRIADSVDRTDRMISDLLDASRLEAGERITLKFETCDLAAAAEEVSNEFATRYGDRFVVEREGDTAGLCSAEGIRRVLENLISNAVKYGEVGTPITTRVRRIDDRLLLSVHNSGTIIPAEEQKKLFQPFHRTDIAQASEKHGWGLGLSLVKGIVEAHGGIVKVESYLNGGTTFTVDLPATTPVAPAEG